MDVRSLRPLTLPAGLSALLLALSLSTLAAPSPIAWQGSVDIAVGRGEKGPWRQNDSRYDYVDDPAVAMDERGRLVVAWTDQARKDIWCQRFAADGLTRIGKPVNVSRSPATFSWLPRVAIAPDAQQHVFILWQEIIFSGASHGGEMFFARSEDGGAVFSEPLNISNHVGGDGKGRINKEVWHNGSYDLVAGADGVLYAVWTEYDGPLWFSRSTDGGKHFSRPKKVAGGGDAKPIRGPSLAIGKGRELYLAWTTGEDDSADIHVAKSLNDGETFGDPIIVFKGKGYSDAPRLAVGGTGTVHLVFAESAGGPFERYHVRYARSMDGARSFESPRDISSLSGKGAAFPSLGINASGNVFVTWEVFHERGSRPRGMGMTVSLDGGRNFSAPQLIPGSAAPDGGGNGSYQGLLMKKLAVGDSGAVAVVNSSMKENERSRVWLLWGNLSR
jgi:hypothetical protein